MVEFLESLKTISDVSLMELRPYYDRPQTNAGIFGRFMTTACPASKWSGSNDWGPHEIAVICA